MLDQLNDNKAKLLGGFEVNPNISSRHVCNVTLSGLKQNLMPYPKLYTPSTLNIDFIQWHTQLIVCAVK